MHKTSVRSFYTKFLLSFSALFYPSHFQSLSFLSVFLCRCLHSSISILSTSFQPFFLTNTLKNTPDVRLSDNSLHACGEKSATYICFFSLKKSLETIPPIGGAKHKYIRLLSTAEKCAILFLVLKFYYINEVIPLKNWSGNCTLLYLHKTLPTKIFLEEININTIRLGNECLFGSWCHWYLTTLWI